MSGPKVVSLIIHVTRQENFKQMQQAGQRFINILTPRDTIAVHFNTFNKFQPADTSNTGRLKMFIGAQNFSLATTALNDTFSTVFQHFSMVGNITCHRIVVLFSDSSLYKELPDQIRRFQLMPRVDIFTYTFGGLSVDPSVHQAIACLFRGAWFGIGSQILPSIDDIIASYLNFYPATLPETNEMTWTGPTEELLSRRNVSTGCLPVYHNKNADNASALLGVLCIDMDIETFYSFSGGRKVRIREGGVVTAWI